MGTAQLAMSPLQLDPLTRDYWGHYDAWIISQLAPLAENECYQPKFYKAPASADEVIPAWGNASYGLKITPGGLIFGFYLPGLVSTLAPLQFNVQIIDQSLRHKLFDEPVPSIFLSNFKPTALSANLLLASGGIGSFPSLLSSPYPVVGDGLFMVQIWDTSGTQQRIELVIGVLEVTNQC
jgi:hypothetical protein